MVIKNKKTKKNVLLIVIILVLATGLSLYWYKKKHIAAYKSQQIAIGQPAGGINYSPPTNTEKQAGDQQKQADINRQSLDNQATSSNSNASQTSPGANNVTGSPSSNPASTTNNQTANTQPSGNITVSIARASQAGAGQPLNIRAIISGASSGECDIALTKEGQPSINKTFAVIFQATSSTCQDANIDASTFLVGGEWNLQIFVKNNSSKSAPVSQVVNIIK